MPYSIAVALFGGTAPYLQTYFASQNMTSTFIWYGIVLGVLSGLVVLTLPETKGDRPQGPVGRGARAAKVAPKPAMWESDEVGARTVAGVDGRTWSVRRSVAWSLPATGDDFEHDVDGGRGAAVLILSSLFLFWVIIIVWSPSRRARALVHLARSPCSSWCSSRSAGAAQALDARRGDRGRLRRSPPSAGPA